MGLSFKNPVLIVIFFISLVLALGWFFYNKNQTAKKQTATNAEQNLDKVSNLTNLSPADFDSSVKKQYATAKAKADYEQKGFALSSIEVTVGSNLQIDNTSTRYIFTSDEDSRNNWMITLNNTNGNFIRALVPKEDYAGSLQVVNTSLWKFNFVTALQLAEKNGGMDFREQNLKFSGVKIALKHSGSNNWLLWIVEYQAPDNTKTIQVDANSGKLVE
jgi:cytoskeletal protein RodZ